MTSFVESCVETAIGRAVSVERRSRHRPRARKLLNVLKDRKNILITTHQQPDPDALASSLALRVLLRAKLKDAKVSLSVKGTIGGGYNRAFAQQLSGLELVPWDDAALDQYDAIIVLDVQPLMRSSPLPHNVQATAVIDHHRSGSHLPRCPFCDVRPDVGATSSIIFSYFMELEVDITPELAATLLFAIETDLAGAAGQPGDLDNMALSSLTLMADTHMLYKMRYVDLPQSSYIAHAHGLANAVYFDNAMISHLDRMESPEAPAVIADFLLRFQPVQWVLVTAVNGSSLAMSLRTSASKGSAADVMRKLLRKIGDGGGHKTKAGGNITMESGSPAEVDKLRNILKRRLLRSLGIKMSRGQKLVPEMPRGK
ncbi:MAG TPA: DHH family phosphoesterase [Tepidisphaeraceae bacterium]|jgi:nanoRNase/pAp phosphatase (c-di-AMP/oligoRNAs hydrolase)|nr:DHH family phosphoesterase [Tepidisphaeraceae bacterium]